VTHGRILLLGVEEEGPAEEGEGGRPMKGQAV